jgi:1,4-alpha-glucan branching enzyme
VNFDGPGSLEVRRFVVDNALMWLADYHCDGLRLDAVHAIFDESARNILEQLADEVDVLAAGVGRPLFLMAESDLNDPRFVRSPEIGGLGMGAAWADDWHHALHAAPGVGVRRTVASVPSAGPGPSTGRVAGQPVRRVYPKPRPGRQPGRRRPQ